MARKEAGGAGTEGKATASAAGPPNGKQPDLKGKQPGPKEQQPAPKGKQPGPKNQQPAPTSKQPGPKDQQPAPPKAPPTGREPVIRLQGVSKVFKMGQVQVQALKGVDLTIYPGEFVSIMGPSGSGKSTLLNLIGCLDRPTTGTCEIAGRRADKLSDNALADLRNEFLGFVFQDFSLLAHRDARQNVELPLIYRGLSGAERRQRAMTALEAVGLGHRATHRPRQLSGGEQQRVAIARALAARPILLLADEPTGALDSVNSSLIMGVFQRLNRDYGLTILQVTHEEEIARHSERILRMRDGRIESDEPVTDRIIVEAPLELEEAN